MKLREKTPTRKSDVAHQKDYHAYRDQLASDFNHRCGYCDDRDAPRAASFEIDHFVPQTVDSDKITDYANLVYACKSCNNAKRAKWPTNDKALPNNGKEGWIDPCLKDYEAQFERLEDGRIHPLTEIGIWMYDNLKLWKKQHEILWNVERLEVNYNQLRALHKQGLLPDELKDSLFQLCDQLLEVLKSFYNVV